MPKTSNLAKESNKNYLDHNDLWKTYTNKHKITKHDWDFIVNTFFQIMGYNMVNEGRVYRLPYGLSNMGIFKIPTFGRGHFDYQLFKETGQKVYKKNLHSNAFVGVFKWNNRWPRLTLPTPAYAYRFTPARDLARYLSKQIREKNTIIKYYDY